MDTLLVAPALRIYAVSATLVALQLVALALWTGTIRALHKAFTNAEDARLNHGTLVERDIEAVDRVHRAHRNAIENAVPFLIVGLLFAATGPSAWLATLLCYGYVGARVLHSIVYLRGLQPWRTLSFGIGVLCIGAMAVEILRALW